MDITKYNFEEEFDNIKKVIEESTFLAIDGEFTGLSNGSVGRICPFDTPAERYRKERDGASDFLLMQFGLCAFKAIETEKRYEARPFNFYLFPCPENHQSPDRRFLCQSSSLDFLISHNFDFNKVFREGISYLTHDQETKLREKLEQRLADRNNSLLNSLLTSPDGAKVPKKSAVVPKEHEGFIAEMREKIESYLKAEDTEPLVFPPTNAFQRKLVFQSLKPDYPLVNMETKTGEKKERYIVVTKCSDSTDAAEMELNKHNLERMKLDVQLGFTKVMRLITESGKLVVGHNMYLDVIHSVNHFYTPAPQELEDFKALIGNIFPRLLDTKLMANTSPFKEYFLGTSLEELKFTTTHPPFKPAEIALPCGFSKYSEDGGTFHEAGYDAFVTGSCFAAMVNFLGRYDNPESSFLLPSHSGVKPFVNKLFMMRIRDIPYVNLSGPDVEVNREHVFHVTFPAEWRADNLYQMFEPYGNIQISWLNSTTAYVGLHKKENAKLAASALCQGLGPCHVVSYHSHKLMKQLQSPATPSPSLNTLPASSTPMSQVPCLKRKSPPSSDPDYPHVKVSRKSLTKDTIPYPSIPEEDEDVEMHECQEEDVGIPMAKENLNKKGQTDSKSEANVDSTNNSKLFQEPDSW